MLQPQVARQVAAFESKAVRSAMLAAGMMLVIQCRSFTAKSRISQYWLPVDYKSTDPILDWGFHEHCQWQFVTRYHTHLEC